MEKKTIKCPRCHGILEVTNPKNEPVLMITCPNPQCGAKMRLTFDTGETIIADHEAGDDIIGHIMFEGRKFTLTEGENTVGRQSVTSKSTIQLSTDDMSISRLHLRIMVHRLKNGRFKAIISDVRKAEKMLSLPTYIDDEPLMPEDAYVLENGDMITLGKTKIRYVK